MTTRSNDYGSKMPWLSFPYDETYYPKDSELPDPQMDPLIFGSRTTLDKVGINGVDLPIKFLRRDGTAEQLYVKASLYGSLDDPNIKGLNLSRFPIIMHQLLKPQMIEADATGPSPEHFSIDVMKDMLTMMAKKQGSRHAYGKFRFAYPWVQEALRTRKEFANKPADESLIFEEAEGKYLSHDKAEGYIFYQCELEGQLHDGVHKFYLTVDYVYSSTCPCSFELAQDAREHRGKAANGHSQRSIAKIKVEFDPDKVVWIEDVVELARRQVPTEVIVICKRRDEQAFAELNGSNLLFTEDAARLLYEGLDEWHVEGRISDFSIVTEHIESLHPWSATAVVTKGVKGGLR